MDITVSVSVPLPLVETNSLTHHIIFNRCYINTCIFTVSGKIKVAFCYTEEKYLNKICILPQLHCSLLHFKATAFSASQLFPPSQNITLIDLQILQFINRRALCNTKSKNRINLTNTPIYFTALIFNKIRRKKKDQVTLISRRAICTKSLKKTFFLLSYKGLVHYGEIKKGSSSSETDKLLMPISVR